MTPDDAKRFAAAVVTVLAIGIPLLAWLFGRINSKKDDRPYFMRHREHQVGANRTRVGTVASDERLREVVLQESVADFEHQIQHVRTEIPFAAADVLVQRGRRLIQEGSFGQGLIVFLAMLYHAVDAGESRPGALLEIKKQSDLPAHLPECLRGAAECYRGLSMPQHAIRFLQAERLIYEEMVSQLGKRPDNSRGTEILSTLFNGESGGAGTHRCRVLSDVAEQCLRLGYPKVALAYRVKAAAVKRKMGGQTLDSSPEELKALAESLQACEPPTTSAAANSTSDE